MTKSGLQEDRKMEDGRVKLYSLLIVLCTTGFALGEKHGVLFFMWLVIQSSKHSWINKAG